MALMTLATLSILVALAVLTTGDSLSAYPYG